MIKYIIYLDYLYPLFFLITVFPKITLRNFILHIFCAYGVFAIYQFFIYLFHFGKPNYAEIFLHGMIVGYILTIMCRGLLSRLFTHLNYTNYQKERLEPMIPSVALCVTMPIMSLIVTLIGNIRIT